MTIPVQVTALKAFLLPVFAFAAGAPVPADQLGPAHVITIPQFTAPARLSTDLNAPPWNQAARITGLLALNTRDLDKRPTYVYVCYDRMSLWLAYRCEGLAGRKLKIDAVQRDGKPAPDARDGKPAPDAPAADAAAKVSPPKVWWDDAAEFYCDPQQSGREYYQFDVNAAGVTYDGYKDDGDWNAKFEKLASADAEGFTIAMRIPFAQIKARSPEPGRAWGVNFVRHGPAGSSSWIWAYNGLQSPRQFGTMIFGGPKTPAIRVDHVEPFRIGANRFKLDNPTGLTCSITGRDRDGEPILRSSLPGERDYAFSLQDDGVRTVEVQLAAADGKLAASWWSQVTTPELTGRLVEWTRRIGIMSRVAPRFPASVASEANRWIAYAGPRLREAQAIVADKTRWSAENWRKLAAILDDFDKRLGDLSCYARTLEHFPKAAFGIGFDSPMRKVLIRDHAFGGWFDSQVTVSLAANEHEAVQVVAIPFRRDLRNVRVKAAIAATQPAAATARPTCTVSLVGHVDVDDDPPYDSTYKGFWPDPLLNFVQTADVKAGEHVAFWIDVATAKGTPAGDYRGTITITADGCEPVLIPLTVHVWGFELIDGTHLQNAFTYHQPAIGGFYKQRWTTELARKYQDFVLDHRLGLDNLYRHEPPDLGEIKYAVSRGTNAFNLMFTANSDAKQRMLKELTRMVPILRRAGLAAKAYVYGFDEIKKDKFDEARETFEEVHRRFPGIRTMTTAQDTSFGDDSGLRKAVDIWVPLTPSYDLAEAERLRKQHKQMWWYVCLVPTHPYANWFVEYPAIEPRLLMGAMSYKYHVDGFLYYLLNNNWGRNREVISSGPCTKWDPASCPNSKGKWANGDGNLFYPGADGPLSSIRFENIRDGLEDYEYLYMLAEGVKRLETRSGPPGVDGGSARAAGSETHGSAGARIPTGAGIPSPDASAGIPSRTPTHAGAGAPSPDAGAGIPSRTLTREELLAAARAQLAVPNTVCRSVVEYTTDPAALAAWRARTAELIEAIQRLNKP